ncbi:MULTISPECIES: transposase [unclassified Geobacillus]|uniref:transposase n=1 Tax=unclassified Geobacillus TaxID=2642459 RepID=UPI001E34E0DB|nr:transposase [Geobacillus sp. Y412MC52]
MLSSLDVRRPVYVLMDSWYPSKALVEACLKKGFHVIAMLKTNRILYPNGVAVQAKRLARSIEPNDTPSSRWEKSIIASIVAKERSTVSTTRWCCSLGKPISR